jgi:hypothetical protein
MARTLAVAALMLALPSVASGAQVRSAGHRPVVRPANLQKAEPMTRAAERAPEPASLRAPDPDASATPAATNVRPPRRFRRTAPRPFRLFDPLHWHRMAVLAPTPRV